MNIEMQKVLDKIDELISKKGFVYALIMAQIEDETIATINIEKRNNHERLSCNEILFIWSILVNKEDFWQYPEDFEVLYSMKCEIHRLMDELHLTFFSGLASHVQEIMNGKPEIYKPYYDGAAFQEAIFYSGGALYDEEYIYYIKKRYEEDTQWLKDNKGYDKDEFCDIASKIKQTIVTKIRRFRLLSLPETWVERLEGKPSELTEAEFRKELTLWQFFYNQEERLTLQEICDRLKNAVSFTKEDIHEYAGAENYLKLFSVEPSKGCNEACREPGDLSILMSTPVIKTPDGSYLITEVQQVFKSMYDVPRYWLNGQLDEHKKIRTHIGDFSETQTLKVLKGIFGENCYKDVIVQKGKNQVTDIDALCIWKDYAICFQIKSKGLTLASRQGNLESIRTDFTKSFQAAYKQGVKCREALLNQTEYNFIDKETQQKVPLPLLREVYIVCETSDEYPSLTHQMTVLLHREPSEPAALALNVFDVNLIGMYLNEPYYLMHYVHNRLKHYGNTRSDVEMNCLVAYTYNRLCLEGSEYDAFMFDNSFAKAIDAELLPKYAKNEAIKVDNGIWRDATFDALIKEIDSSPQSSLSQAVLNLLDFSKDEVKRIGMGINELLHKGKEGAHEYYSFRKGNFGFTYVVLEMGTKQEVHRFLEAFSLNEIKKNKSKNWLTIVHFLGSDSLVGTLAYVSGK